MPTIQQVKQRFGIIGNSQAINEAIEVAIQVAPTDVTVLVQGENGSGKDVFSRIIHQFSKRKHHRFIAINCGAIPEGTLDSELFGHERGAFTSAYESRKGYFEEVEGGTIFLDEIGEMPMATQARLLRLLENGEYLRVGSSKVRTANVRVIAATNKNLIEMIRQGKFREDLYFRLNTITILVPPLREREDDKELLFQYFSLEFSDKYRREPLELDKEALTLLDQYRWPGNIRELRNLVEKLTVLVKGNIVTNDILRSNLLVQESYLPAVVGSNRNQSRNHREPEVNVELLYKLIFDLQHEVKELKQLIYMSLKRSNTPTTTPLSHPVSYDVEHASSNFPVQVSRPLYPTVSEQHYSTHPEEPTIIEPEHHHTNAQVIEESLSIEDKEKELIIKALQKHKNNRKKAARELGISERTLYRKIKSFGINM